MNPDIEERIDGIEAKVSENKRLIEENHRLLKKLHRSLVWRRTLTIFYWVIIIGVAVGAFYFLQPYVEQVTGTYDTVQGVLNGSSNPTQIFFRE